MKNSTKETIKHAALSLFSRRGYDGTTMNDISKQVGITAPALYAHFKGKEELYVSIYDDLMKDYIDLMDHLLTTAETMDIEVGLYYVFEQFIMDSLRRPEIRNFWVQVPISTPPVLKEKLFYRSRDYDMAIEERLQKIVSKGISQGRLRDDDPVTMAFSHRLMRDGTLTWMSVIPGIDNEKYIKAFWNNLWFGLKK